MITEGADAPGAPSVLTSDTLNIFYGFCFWNSWPAEWCTQLDTRRILSCMASANSAHVNSVLFDVMQTVRLMQNPSIT